MQGDLAGLVTPETEVQCNENLFLSFIIHPARLPELDTLGESSGTIIYLGLFYSCKFKSAQLSVNYLYYMGIFDKYNY